MRIVSAPRGSSVAFKIAIAGLGTVGAGTVRLIQNSRDLLRLRCGQDIEIAAVSARMRKERGLDLSGATWFDDAVQMAQLADVDLVMELIGGAEGTARAVVEAALARGVPVITANKALLARHGRALAGLAEQKETHLLYEAAVAGGLPIIKVLREGLAANDMHSIYGILNGTCNYILSTMQASGRDFDDVLADAQRLGYAEADPSADVDGFDAAHKLTLLCALVFGRHVDFDRLSIEGIRHIRAADIRAAEDLGYKIKHLGVGRMVGGKLCACVYPCMVPVGDPISAVDGVLNAVVCHTGDSRGGDVGSAVLQGPGAGAGPTASAIVADLLDYLRGLRLPVFGVPVADLRTVETQTLAERAGAFYLRLSVRDQPGVIADVMAILRDCAVSVCSMIQHNSNPGEVVSVIIVTHSVSECDLNRAIVAINDLSACTEPLTMIRIANLQAV